MKELIQFPKVIFEIPFLGCDVAVNVATVISTLVISLLIIGFCLWTVRSLERIPGRRQVLLEMIVGAFDNLLKDGLGEDGRKFVPFIVSLFLFILLANWMGVIPKFAAPTRDINTCLALGLMVFATAHISAINKKGFLKYSKSYFQPFWLLFPSNVFSEISKVLSHSFRLFGNIFAGGVVISMVPAILWNIFKWWGLPINILSMPILNAFFGLVLGSVQAFVFTLLAIAYIGVLRED